MDLKTLESLVGYELPVGEYSIGLTEHKKTLSALHNFFSYDYSLTFANGGDQTNGSIPEAKICKELGIKLIDGLGDKIQSSSWLLKK